jgi:hypothetical protein
MTTKSKNNGDDKGEGDCRIPFEGDHTKKGGADIAAC